MYLFIAFIIGIPITYVGLMLAFGISVSRKLTCWKCKRMVSKSKLTELFGGYVCLECTPVVKRCI